MKLQRKNHQWRILKQVSIPVEIVTESTVWKFIRNERWEHWTRRFPRIWVLSASIFDRFPLCSGEYGLWQNLETMVGPLGLWSWNHIMASNKWTMLGCCFALEHTGREDSKFRDFSPWSTEPPIQKGSHGFRVATRTRVVCFYIKFRENKVSANIIRFPWRTRVRKRT